MTDEKNLGDAEDNSIPTPASAPTTPPPAPYVRARPAHRSVEPINDLEQDDETGRYVAHDSAYTGRGSALSGGAYRRSRADAAQLRRDLHYGQYLEIPKGRRDIFASRERKTRIKTAIALIVVLAVLVLAVYLVWEYMQVNWGATS